jgi:hypothetical protein
VAFVLGSLGCGPSLPYPAELEGSHDVDGRGFCEYTIDGRYEVLRSFSPRLRLFPVPEGHEDCADFMLSAPDLSPEACGRVTSSGAIWRAEITAADNSDIGLFPSIDSYQSGVGGWGLSEDVTFTATLTYDPIERQLTFELDGAGVAGRSSVAQGSGTVHCVFEATVDPE